MRINIGQPNNLGDDGLITVIDPPISIDISSLFELVVFTTSTNSAPPFTEITLNWEIQSIDRMTRIEDYAFRLNAFQHEQLNSIQAEDSTTFTLVSNTRITISGRKKGGGAWSFFDQALIISLDASNCEIINHYGPFIDDAIFNQLETLLSTTKELRFRRETLPADPDWTIERIRYKFPLEIVIDNFFNADLDVQMDIRFSMEHGANNSILNIDTEFDVDASFDTGEIILGSLIPGMGASTLAISKTLNEVLPMVFDCKKAEIEAEIGRQVLDNRVETALTALNNGRVFSVRIVPRSATSIDNFIRVVLCSTSEPDGSDLVVDLTELENTF